VLSASVITAGAGKNLPAPFYCSPVKLQAGPISLSPAA
jgi:hypothetical protein